MTCSNSCCFLVPYPPTHVKSSHYEVKRSILSFGSHKQTPTRISLKINRKRHTIDTKNTSTPSRFNTSQQSWKYQAQQTTSWSLSLVVPPPFPIPGSSKSSNSLHTTTLIWMDSLTTITLEEKNISTTEQPSLTTTLFPCLLLLHWKSQSPRLLRRPRHHPHHPHQRLASML